MDDLGVTVSGQPRLHWLYHFRLAYSDFKHFHVVLGSESFVALAKGLRDMPFKLCVAPGVNIAVTACPQPGAAFGAMAILLALELCDMQSEVPDHVLGSRNDGLNLGQLARGGDQCAFRDRRAGLCRGKGGAQNSDL